jgi:prepilin-type N-terminal cleavage/methylation domain-containing protein
MNPQRDARRLEADAGMTLIEVVVALLVFAIIASGVVAGMTTVARMTGDDRSRVVAANLAAEQTDLARAIGDPFKLKASTTTQSFPTADGSTQTFTIARTVSWVSSSGADISCGSSTNLFFMRVHVLVTWDGELPTTVPVETDTILAPAGRITDPTTGTIAVSVVGADGKGRAGVNVSVVPSSGGAALSAQPAPTDVDGCTYVPKVAPGTYAVTISASGYVDVNQDPSPTKPAVVTVGSTQSVSFQYDKGGTFSVEYAGNYAPSSAAMAAQLPVDLDTTFINPTGGLYVTGTPTSSLVLHPFSAGYTAVAGVLGTAAGMTTCAAVDPSAWPAKTVAGTKLTAGQRGAGAGATPGGVAPSPIKVPMGVVLVKSSASGYLKAVQGGPAAGIAGEPGCTKTATYTFGNVLKNGVVAVALPFGTWTLYSGTAAGQTILITGANLSSPTNAVASEITAPGVLTLDPRAAG